MNKPIYLDYAAATPVSPAVIEAMLPYLSDNFYNPSSSYQAARLVKRDIEGARARVAHWLGARTSEIIFTAGATESINAAIHGVMRQIDGGNLLVAQIEHDAVLATAANYPHKIIPVQPNGSVEIADIAKLIDDQTVLISISYANNEIGTIQPLRKISQLIEEIRDSRLKKGNKMPLYLHTDASQAASYLDLHASSLGVDLMTLNGGKIYGPKQTGVLFVKAGLRLHPFVSGGGQEFGVRSGTENVPGIIGLASAIDRAQGQRVESVAKQAALRDELQRELQKSFPNMAINGNLKKRLPNNLHVSWPGVDGERLVMLLDERGVQASTGSACAANKGTASHVLQAIGLDEQSLQGSLRLTIGEPTTVEDIKKAAEIIIKSVEDLL